jgi:propanediol dehydratase large subunit
MKKLNKKYILEMAQKEFENSEYMMSLQNYALLLSDYPDLIEAKIGVYLSDLGMESSEEAQALFDYYQVIRIEKDIDALEVIENLIDTLHSSKRSLQELLLNPIEEQIEYADGIRYEDFIKLVEARGSFKRAFEDIMFSTKVIITQKEEFIDFIKHLATQGFKETALYYLDSASSSFSGDQEIFELYNLMEFN